MDRINKIEGVGGKIFKLAIICYHEARHSIQEKFDINSYEGFLRKMEKIFRILTNNKDYENRHDNYSFEVGANLYGVRKAKEYLKRNYPELYEKEKEEIKKVEDKYTFDYMSYDVSELIDGMFKVLNYYEGYGSKLFTFGNRIRISNNYVLENEDYVKYILEKKIPVFGVFVNKDYSFKSISEIVNNEEFKKIDKRIVYAFFSSQTFLNGIDMGNLSAEELIILNESLEYTNTVYQNQLKLLNGFLNDKSMNVLEYLKKTEKSNEKDSFFI